MKGEARTAKESKKVSVLKMQFILTGFTPDMKFRVFAFQGIEADRTWTEFTVRTDLSLIQRYGIRVQELPLLCRGLLERRDEGEQERTFTFTEEEMRMHANSRAADQDAAQGRKSTRRPPAHRLTPAGKFHSGNDDARREVVQPGHQT
jgi:hypothetical protein